MKKHFAKIMVDEHGANYFAWGIITDGWFKLPYIKKFLDVPFKLELMIIEGEHGQWASDTENIRLLAEISLKKLKAGSYNLKEITRLHKTFGKKVLDRSKKINKLLNTYSPAALANELTKVWADFMALNCLGFVIVWADLEFNVLSKHLEKTLGLKDISQNKIPEILSLLISPTLPLKPWQQKLELIKIAKKHKTYKPALTSKEFERHYRQYTWLQYGYQGPELTKTFFADQLKKIFSASPEKHYESHVEYFKKLSVKQRYTYKKLRLSSEEKKLFEAAKQIMYLKAYRIDVRHYFHWVMDRVFAKLAAEHYLPLKWFHYAERKNILELVRTGKTDTLEGYSHAKFLLRVSEKRGRHFVSKKQSKSFLKKALIAEDEITNEEIKGSVAFPGKVKGTVKIVLSIKDLHKVNKGDIMVSPATNPNLLPAMQKASCFVTDSGGITSHAAIVAREMRKPCVIGTKIATKILKDGDLVEVDANKGIVKKL